MCVFLMFFATLIFSSRIFAFQFTFFSSLPGCPDKTQSCPAKTQTKVPDLYEYSPSWMADIRKGYERVWWCGFKEGLIHPRLHAEQTIGGIRNFYGRDVLFFLLIRLLLLLSATAQASPKRGTRTAVVTLPCGILIPLLLQAKIALLNSLQMMECIFLKTR